MQLFGNRRKSDEDEIQVEKPIPESVPPPPTPVKQSIGFDTVLGMSCTIEGMLSTEGNIRIDGMFAGTLNITGNVLVGETAQINADIDAANVSIAGTVKGNVTGNKVQLLRTAHVWGDITATSLSTEEGAFIDGKISMQSPDTAKSTFDKKLDDIATDVETQVDTVSDIVDTDISTTSAESIILENEDNDD